MKRAGAALVDAWRAEVQRLGYAEDPAQRTCIGRFARLLDDLEDRARRRGPIARLAERLGRRPAPPRGIYLWGGVGRGKTFLMDLFYRAVPGGSKERVHFHRFMLSVHRELAALKSEPDPLALVAAGVASRASVLCFDELYVGDVADAMVLARLFRLVIDRGVVLVFTSNTEPAGLYPHGLQRERFLAAIEMIERHCEVCHIDDGVDYRLRTLRETATYLCPHDENTDASLERTFRRLAGDEPVDGAPLSVLGRSIPVRLASEGVAWFGFDDLCRGPRSKADYAELSRCYHTLVISDVPLLGVDSEDPARRFIELVDELYDRRVNVLMSAAAPPDVLYRGRRLGHAFTRTASRLHEFADPGYMAQEHRP